MELISRMVSGPVHSPAAATGAKGPLKVGKPEEDDEKRPVKPETDEYIPEEKQESSGRYWLGKDGEGKHKIYFDNPEKEAPESQAAGTPGKPGGLPGPEGPKEGTGPESQKEGMGANGPKEGIEPEGQKEGMGPEGPKEDEKADGPGKGPDKKVEKCTGNTDRVDREIEKLKKRRDELKKQIHSEKDGMKIKELEKKLSQVERELKQKDNDAYRRAHTVFY